MSCACVISAEDADDFVDVIEQVVRAARKPHKCTECREPILPGQRYEYMFGKFDGDTVRLHTCELCVEIGRFYSCGGYIPGEIWNDLEEGMFEHFHHGCLEAGEEKQPLSAAAKRKIVDRWRRWKGLAA